MGMGEKSKYIHKSHNVTVLIYHIVCPSKYRKIVFSEDVEKTLEDVCIEIEKRYEIYFLEIGADKEHVHFLVQSVPMYSPTSIVQKIKSITAREILRMHPKLKKQLWGGEFWSKGYFVSTIGKHGNEDMLKEYVRKQGVGNDYKVLQQRQLSLF